MRGSSPRMTAKWIKSTGIRCRPNDRVALSLAKGRTRWLHAGYTPHTSSRLQHPPQSGHRTERIEPIHRRDQLLRAAVAEDRRHQVERLGGDLVGGHLIAGRTAHLVGAMVERAAVRGFDLYDGLARRHGGHQLLVRHRL